MNKNSVLPIHVYICAHVCVCSCNPNVLMWWVWRLFPTNFDIKYRYISFCCVSVSGLMQFCHFGRSVRILSVFCHCDKDISQLKKVDDLALNSNSLSPMLQTENLWDSDVICHVSDILKPFLPVWQIMSWCQVVPSHWEKIFKKQWNHTLGSLSQWHLMSFWT